MYNFNPTLKPELVQGKRVGSPYFDMLVNRTSYKHTLFNFTTDKVYKQMTMPEIKMPKMHSSLIPLYLKFRKYQEEAVIDNGYRLYEKWPLQRALYRAGWACTGLLLTTTFVRLYFFWLEHR